MTYWLEYGESVALMGLMGINLVLGGNCYAAKNAMCAKIVAG